MEDLSEWLRETLVTAQNHAIERAVAAGAYTLEHIETRFVPDMQGGYTIHFEWEMGVPRG